MGTRRRTWGVAAVGLLLAVGTALPASAADAAAGHRCAPRLLTPSPLPGATDTRVLGLGPHGVAVGVSGRQPVYWTGTRVHRVPLPAGATGGSVAAINRNGLMVGGLSTADGPAAFSYRLGARAVRLLPGGSRAVAVNDHGHVVGTRPAADGFGVDGLEWVGTELRRQLTTAPDQHVYSVTGIDDSGRIVGDTEGADEYGEFTQHAEIWPAAVDAPPTHLGRAGDLEESYLPTGIDRSGRVVGVSEEWHSMTEMGVVWTAPYDREATPAPWLGVRTAGRLDAVSPTTGVFAGTASDSPYEGPMDPPLPQAQVWPGQGPMLALPGLGDDWATQADAVADDGRVGGYAWSPDGQPDRALVWTCALEQAQLPSAATGEPETRTR